MVVSLKQSMGNELDHTLEANGLAPETHVTHVAYPQLAGNSQRDKEIHVVLYRLSDGSMRGYYQIHMQISDDVLYRPIPNLDSVNTNTIQWQESNSELPEVPPISPFPLAMAQASMANKPSKPLDELPASSASTTKSSSRTSSTESTSS